MLQWYMSRIAIATLLTILIIQPALPVERNALSFMDRLLYYQSMNLYTPSYNSAYTEDTSKDDSYDDNYDPYSDAPSDAQYIVLDFPSLEEELEIIICEGEEENYHCSPASGYGDYDVYEY